MMKLADYDVDFRLISPDEAVDYLHGLRGRERGNHRRTQAWFDHCARIRSHPNSMISITHGVFDSRPDFY